MEISLINVNVPHKRATSVFPGEPAAKNLPANAVDTGSSPDPGVSHNASEQLSSGTTTAEPVP